MKTFLKWMIELDLRLRVAALGFIVIAINPILYPLSSGSKESFSEVEFKTVETSFVRDFTDVVARIRDQSVWIDKKVVAAIVPEIDSDAKQRKIDELKANQQWVLIGLIYIGDERQAVLKQGQNYVHSVKVGDTLPSGERIISIKRDSIVLSMTDGDKELNLYPVSL